MPFLSQKKKRDWSQHSKSNRRKRKLQEAAVMCNKIDQYYPILSQMDKILAENQELKLLLATNMQKMCNMSSLNVNLPSFPEFKLLELLMQCAIRNAGKKPNAFTYDSTLKEYATLCFVLGGPQLYGILCGALPLPSVTTCRRNLLSRDRLEECYFRISEAKEYLSKRNLPTKVVICEDGTRVTGRIQYDIKTNQVIGFVPRLKDGLPEVRSFPATSADLIKQHFESGVVSSNAYVIMLQPLSVTAAAFCVCLYGTDNRFDSTSVDLRWNWMTKAFNDVGLDIVAFSSDGDNKLLKTMISRTFTSSDKWHWFQASLDTSQPVCVQDTIHLLVKLRVKIVKASDILPMGKKYVASRGHIIELISSVSKDQHQLTKSIIEAKDKMNHRAAQKLCEAKVTQLMRQHIPESEATATYLDMMREVTASYLDPSMEPLQRVKLLWKWTFFLRLWRKWIQSNSDYSLSHNFITLNAYTCVEINAHALINIIRKLRDSEEPELFLIWLISSQACEKFFRDARSMSGVRSTVTNFSIFELICKILRIEYIGENQLKLKDIVNFPIYQKLFRASTSNGAPTFLLPEDYEIENAVNEAFQCALGKCVSLGLTKKTSCPPCPLSSKDIIEAEVNDVEIDDELAFDPEDSEEPPTGEDVDESEVLDDVTEDLLMVSSGLMGLQTYNNIAVTPESPFIKVLDGNGNPCIIRKTSFCWLLSSGDTKMSSDRLIRVQTSTASHSNQVSDKSPPADKPARETEVGIGDWCAFTSETGAVVIGRIMAFSYMSGRTWRNQEYSLLHAPVNPPESCSQRGIGCLCSWFNIGKHGKLVSMSMDTHGYYNIDKYICTIPRPKTLKKSLLLSCSLSDIKKIKEVISKQGKSGK